jgi:hypothetical protein
MVNWITVDWNAGFKDKNTLTVTWTRKDSDTVGAEKSGLFEYSMPTNMYWPAIKTELAAKVAAEEGVIPIV